MLHSIGMSSMGRVNTRST